MCRAKIRRTHPCRLMSLRCPHEEALWPIEALIRLRGVFVGSPCYFVVFVVLRFKCLTTCQMPTIAFPRCWFLFLAVVYFSRNEPPRDKTNKVSVRPAKTHISLGIRPVLSDSSLSAWRLATIWGHSEDWSDWVDAQADLSLCWVHTHFVGFVMSRLINNSLLVTWKLYVRPEQNRTEQNRSRIYL